MNVLITNVGKMLKNRSIYPDENITTTILNTEMIGGLIHMATFTKCDNTIVELYYSSKFTVKQFSVISSKLHMIILVDGATHYKLKRQLIEFPNVEIHFSSTFRFNITDIIPHHAIYTGAKPKDWIKLPKLLQSDPVCKHYKYNKNDIITVSDTSGFVHLRIVH